jgi:nitrite reductase/ring-hydroxylating ferredoxin subunit/uncharacterized membrane protein
VRVQPGTALHRLAERTERLSGLDALAGPLARGVDRLVRGAGLKSVLSGSWLGHPLHPLATDAVIGAWTMAAVLDLKGGNEPAARRLVGLGVVAAVPTAASGASDWADMPETRVRRMGLVHAASNSAALVLNAGSYLARRAGRHRVGARLTAASAVPLTVGGFLGAHLAYARGAGVSRTVFSEEVLDWTPVDLAPMPGDDWSQATVHGLPVLARVGEGQAPRVLAATCTHCGARLRAEESAESLCCPSDGSAFSAVDGAVLGGPATTPIPRFLARQGPGDRVEVRSPAPV